MQPWWASLSLSRVRSYTIAGVADLPQDLFPGTDVLVPLMPKATESRTAHDIEAAARLRTGVNREQAQLELTAIAASIAVGNRRTNEGWSMRLIPLSDVVVGPRTRSMVRMVAAAVALLWLLACANVAGLQAARSIARKNEMKTRRALGASVGRLFGQVLTESLVLAAAGTAVGLGLALFAVQALQSFAGESFPRMAEVRIGGPIVGIALAIMAASALLFTIFSGHSHALQVNREISRRERGRDALIVAQVALASVLLLGAGLLLHSFLRLQNVDTGFDPDRLLAVHVSLPGPSYTNQRKVAFFRNVLQQVSGLGEVEAAAATNIPPFSGDSTANRFRLDGEATSGEFHAAAWRAVSPGFFRTLGVALKRGRLFTDRDTDGSPEVVILTESMARKFWPGQDPVGRRLLWGKSGSPKTIVGIVGDLRDVALDAAPQPTMFRPFAQLADSPMTLVIRTKNDSVAATADVRRTIQAVDRDAAIDFQTLRSAMSRTLLGSRASLFSVVAFAVLAMVIAAFGLYGLISYRVNQRQPEIGMRLALGASPGHVLWSVQRRCLALVGSGLAIGLPAGFALSTLMSSLLYETRPAQPSAYAMVVMVFAAVGAAASYGPARRAALMDPAAAIRHEWRCPKPGVHAFTSSFPDSTVGGRALDRRMGSS